MKVLVRELFGFDLTDPLLRGEISQKLSLPQNGSVTIDYCGCLIDYPATSAVSDVVLSHIRGASAPRCVTYLFNVSFPERILLKWFFIGSNVIGLQNGSPTEEQIRMALEQYLHDNSASLIIKVIDPESSTVINIFKYGQQ